mgnify:CR=1 FL=1
MTNDSSKTPNLQTEPVMDGAMDHEGPPPMEDSGGNTVDLEALNDEEQTAKDVSYSPASETETQAKQDAPVVSRDPDVDDDDVRVLPGTGGPDDPGDVVMPEAD